MENPALVKSLFQLFLGGQGVAPASTAVQTRVLNLFSKSIAAANCFPETYEVLSLLIAQAHGGYVQYEEALPDQSLFTRLGDRL